jgi:hypothetical protein
VNLAYTHVRAVNPVHLKNSDPIDPMNIVVEHHELKDVGNSKTTMREYADTLAEYCDSQPWMMEVERIRIEQQPMFKGRRAFSCFRNQTWSLLLYMYFKGKGHPDVGFTHASYKLGVTNPASAIVKQRKKKVAGADKKKYDARKAMSVEIAESLLVPNNPNVWALIESEEKQNDLCDAFLMSLHALFREH